MKGRKTNNRVCQGMGTIVREKDQVRTYVVMALAATYSFSYHICQAQRHTESDEILRDNNIS